MAVNNNIMVRLLVLEITFLILAVVNSYPAFEDNEFKHKNRDKGRSIRGFKNMDLSTARGFGKRTDHYVNLMPSDLFMDNKENSFNQNAVNIDNGRVLQVKRIKKALLLAMTCVVHYDLFSLFSNHQYKRRTMYTDNKRHQHQPTSEFDHMWIPRPGTDPTIFYSPPRFVIVHDHGTDSDGYWTESDDGDHNNRGTTDDKRSDYQVYRPTPDTEVDSVYETTTTKVLNVLADNYDDDSDYVAPGQEWEDDVF